MIGRRLIDLCIKNKIDKFSDDWKYVYENDGKYFIVYYKGTAIFIISYKNMIRPQIDLIEIELTNSTFKRHLGVYKHFFYQENIEKVGVSEIESILNLITERIEKFYPIIEQFKNSSDDFLSEFDMATEMRTVKLSSIINKS